MYFQEGMILTKLRINYSTERRRMKIVKFETPNPTDNRQHILAINTSLHYNNNNNNNGDDNHINNNNQLIVNTGKALASTSSKTIVNTDNNDADYPIDKLPSPLNNFYIKQDPSCLDTPPETPSLTPFLPNQGCVDTDGASDIWVKRIKSNITDTAVITDEGVECD
ncbi:hypothetical protein HELRODRAFT_166337 [Helobdella robusta]|uniref:Uncharacterized protein n=1 Tax=Helobdella robusta TaxID=6412 RepID=T1EY13_HELRO|nr:hypothetical protein HELRODRAFT_166337 [Helobdella robusta]ESN90637.1 hypothetical protein HELRODRAFT_166337 [Helobdella robusta]